jgi:hypothetical protein
MCSLVRDDARKLVTGTAPGGLETVPSDGSHLLACGVRIKRRRQGSNKRDDLPSEGRGGVSPLADHMLRRLGTNGSIAKRRNGFMGGEFSRNRANPHAKITRVACQSSALIVSPPSTRTDAHDLTEGSSERRLIRKARLIRNISQ